MYRQRFGFTGHPLPKDARGKTFFDQSPGYQKLERAFRQLVDDPGLGVLMADAPLREDRPPSYAADEERYPAVRTSGRRAVQSQAAANHGHRDEPEVGNLRLLLTTVVEKLGK